jgi:hypothetical protein
MSSVNPAAAPAKPLTTGWTPVAVPHDRELTLLDATRRNGRDDVFVRAEGQPLWVLHGRRTGADGVRAGDVVSFTPPKLDRQTSAPVVGRVEVVENEKNTFQDGFKPALKPALITSGVFAAALIPLTVLASAAVGVPLLGGLARVPFVLGVVGLPATALLVGGAVALGVVAQLKGERTDAYDKAR